MLERLGTGLEKVVVAGEDWRGDRPPLDDGETL